jgi:hypothetical protein
MAAESKTQTESNLVVADRNASLVLASENVRIGVSGAIYVAPVGTAAPTDASAALPAEWVSLGYLHEDGVEFNPSQTTTNSINAWQNAAEVRKTVTEVKNSFKFKALEIKAATLALYFGRDIKAGDTDYHFGGSGLIRIAVVVDMIDGDEDWRVYAPQAEVTERAAFAWKNSEPVGLETTLSAYPDPSTDNLPFAAWHSKALV